MPYFPANYNDETPENQLFSNPVYGCKVLQLRASADTEVFTLSHDTYMKFASKSSKFANLDDKTL